MTAKFDKKSAGSGNVAQDIENARMRMIYENPADYAAWRVRMGLAKPFQPLDQADPTYAHLTAVRVKMAEILREDMKEDPAMKARIAKLFHALGSGLAPPRSKRRPDYRAPGESLAEYGRQPLAVSDALRGNVSRRDAAE